MGYLRQHADEASPAADAEDGVVVLRRQGAEDEGQPHEHPLRRSRADSVQRCAKPQLLLFLSTKPGNFESIEYAASYFWKEVKVEKPLSQILGFLKAFQTEIRH